MIIASLDLPRCLEVADLLSEFLDGELDDAMRHRVALHLAMCEACAELAATVHALHRLGHPEPCGTSRNR